MTFEEVCEAQNIDAQQAFVRAWRTWGNQQSRPTHDYERYKKSGPLPSYVRAWVAATELKLKGQLIEIR